MVAWVPDLGPRTEKKKSANLFLNMVSTPKKRSRTDSGLSERSRISKLGPGPGDLPSTSKSHHNGSLWPFSQISSASYWRIPPKKGACVLQPACTHGSRLVIPYKFVWNWKYLKLHKIWILFICRWSEKTTAPSNVTRRSWSNAQPNSVNSAPNASLVVLGSARGVR